MLPFSSTMSLPPPQPPVSSPALAGLRHTFLWLIVYMGMILLLYLLLYVWSTYVRRPPPQPLEPPRPREAPPRTQRIGGKVVPYVSSYGKDCAICLDEYREGEVCRVLTKCKHVYHRACIDKWLRTNHHCPLCRGSVHGSAHGSESASSHHYQRQSQSATDV